MKVFAKNLKPGDKYERFGKVLTVTSVEFDTTAGMVTIRTAIGPTQTFTIDQRTLVEVVGKAKGDPR